MSDLYPVLAPRWFLQPGEDPSVFFHFGRRDPDVLPPDQGDALSNPEDETSGGFLTALLPVGAAWGTPDNQARDPQSVIARFWTAMGAGLGDAYRTLFGVVLESTAVTLAHSLEDWEADYGLPDQCFGQGLNPDGRLRALLVKIRSAGTITVGDFIALAKSADLDVTIDEPMPFECGISDCGGAHSTGYFQTYYWIVRVANGSVRRFEAGVSELGVDRLSDYSEAEGLECLFRRVAPAWTQPVFSYS